jgi:hypothetical protein
MELGSQILVRRRRRKVTCSSKSPVRIILSRVIYAMLGQQTFNDIRKLQDKQEHITNGLLDTGSSGEVSLHKVRFDREAIIMNDWHNKWKTAPNDPLPMNLKPLLLLREPTCVSQNVPPLKDKEVLLVHYYPDMVLEARAQQDLKRDREETRYLEDYAEDAVWNSERALGSPEVLEAMRHSGVIDVSGDLKVESGVLRSMPGDYNMPQPTQLWTDSKEIPVQSASKIVSYTYQLQDLYRYQHIGVSQPQSFPTRMHDEKLLYPGKAFPNHGDYVYQQTLPPLLYSDTTKRQLFMCTHTQPFASERSDEVQ